MASRNFYPLRGALEREVCSIFGKITFGAAGAPTITKGIGIASVVRTSAGLYAITLNDSYFTLLGVQFAELKNAVSSLGWHIFSEDIKNKTLSVQLSGPTAGGDTTPVATDPANGDVLLLEMKVKNTALNY